MIEAPADLVETALDLELGDGTVVAAEADERRVIFLAGLHRAERGIAERLAAIAATPSPWPAIDPAKAIPWVEQRAGIVLAGSQRAAVSAALANKVLVITGGPGVGKTTIVNAILRILAAKDVRALCAPTGRAAKRASEATGMEAKTIHRLLEVNPASGGFRRDAEHPIEADLVVVDETSMVDVPLMHALLRAVPDQAAVLLVGDVDQLPSVGPEQVLADLIASGVIPVVRLTEVFRQAAQSRIVQAAHRINRGEMPEGTPVGQDGDFYIVPVDGPETAAERIVALVAKRIPERFGLDPVQDIPALCPMNRGGAGAGALSHPIRTRRWQRNAPALSRTPPSASLSASAMILAYSSPLRRTRIWPENAWSTDILRSSVQ